jgi:hypothetical protein
MGVKEVDSSVDIIGRAMGEGGAWSDEREWDETDRGREYQRYLLATTK